VRVLHVNDSKTPLGSNRDRHELLGRGQIGDGLASFLSHPAFDSLPAIVETWDDQGPATKDVELLRQLRRRGRRRRSAR
jgi:deoxyribonuclease-4